MEIIVKKLPETEVAYIRRTGSYFEPQEHWGRLIGWANTHGLYPPQESFIGISLDNPDLVESKDCRHDACVTIPEGFNKEEHQIMLSIHSMIPLINCILPISTCLENGCQIADMTRITIDITLNSISIILLKMQEGDAELTYMYQ